MTQCWGILTEAEPRLEGRPTFSMDTLITHTTWWFEVLFPLLREDKGQLTPSAPTYLGSSLGQACSPGAQPWDNLPH